MAAPEVEAFLVKAYRAADAALESPMPDVSRMLERQLDIDKNLATSVLCFGACYCLKDQAWLWYRWAKKDEPGLDAIARLASLTLNEAAESFGDCYACTDTADLLHEAAGAMRAATSSAEIASIAYALAHYMITLYYWVDASIPWAELSPVHADLVRARAGSVREA